MTERKDIEAKRQQSWNNALKAYATAYIFQRRASALQFRTRALTFSGIIVPALIGVMATSFYQDKPIPHWTLYTASAVGVIQLILSIWALVVKWDDKLANAIQSAKRNSDLQSRWRELAQEKSEAIEAQFAELLADDAKQAEIDVEQFVTDKEKVRGMRAGLFQYNRECAVGHHIPSTRRLPISLFRSACPVCGELKKRRNT